MSKSSDSRPWSEFDDVDQASESTPFIDYLDMAREVETIAIGKRYADDQLRLAEGHRVLEVGCGSGDDSVRLGALVGNTGSVVGVDFSESMVMEAQRRHGESNRNVSFEQGDAQRLRFSDDEFDAVRAERVFIHIEDPDKALHELIRVAKPGGRVVLMEPDLEKFAFDSRLPDTGHLISQALSSVARNSSIGRSLRRKFIEAGVHQVAVTPFVMAVTDYAIGQQISMLDRLLEVIVENDIANKSKAEAIGADLKRSRDEGTFALYGPYYVATGIVAN